MCPLLADTLLFKYQIRLTFPPEKSMATRESFGAPKYSLASARAHVISDGQPVAAAPLTTQADPLPDQTVRGGPAVRTARWRQRCPARSAGTSRPQRE